MIHGKSTHAPLVLQPSIGLVLFLIWVNEDPERVKLFKSSIGTARNTLDFSLLSQVLNQVSNKCMDEFVEMYPDIAEVIDQEDYKSLYKFVRDNYIN